jgi:hypothetical protein
MFTSPRHQGRWVGAHLAQVWKARDHTPASAPTSPSLDRFRLSWLGQPLAARPDGP